MRSTLRALLASGAAALALTATGCGGTVSDPGGSTSGGPGGSGGPDGKAAITVESARGPVKLDKPATRVVSLEWSYTEELVALGAPPVGSADNANYRTWVGAPGSELPPGTVDVGKRQQPSLEQIKALQPDLIVGDEDRIKANYPQLAAIAPVVSFNPTAPPALASMKGNFSELAEAVGKPGEAAAVLGRLDQKTAEVRQRLERSGKGGAEYALAQGRTANGVPSIRMFTDQALPSQVINQTGLKNTWRGRGDEWGMTTIGVEGLAQIAPSAHFLHVSAASDDPFTGALAGNPVWRDQEFVKAGRNAQLDPGTWMFGGPLSAMQLLDETAKALGA